MQFHTTRFVGVYLIDLEPRSDDRGFFARAFCRNEMIAHGLSGEVVQANTAYTRQQGTVRGLHYQVPPAAETKLVRCLHGAVYDVIVDLRPESTTYRQHLGVELTADNRRQLVIPAGFAHGYQTLTDDAEILYLVSEFYTPDCERGLRYNDPALGITWPVPVTLVSDKDLGLPDVASLPAAVRA